MAPEQEGVVKFTAEHSAGPLPHGRFGALARELAAWREILARLGLVGQDAERYGGAGFGNVSGRVGPFPGAPGARSFLVTGTQTGGLSCMALEHFCVVTRWDVARNRVASHGPALPSSESMTHGALYDLGPHIRFVLHAHTPLVWRRAARLRLPTTAPAVAYGTPAMAEEVRRLARETPLLERRALAMGGHEDGIIVFGRTAAEAGEAMTSLVAAAYALQFDEAGRLCR